MTFLAHRPLSLLPIAALLLVSCDGDTFMYGPNAQVKQAEERVNAMLDGMKTGGDGSGADLQESVCRWYNGKIFIADRDVLTRAYDGFEEWRREKSLEDRRIAFYSIASAEPVKDSAPPTVRMTVSIEGERYVLLVPKGEPIRWGEDSLLSDPIDPFRR